MSDTQRLPTVDDFPNNVTILIVSPPDNKPASNILILLHGLGDSHEPFSVLGQKFNFPETACLAVRALQTLPFDLNGFHWGDDMIFDNSTGRLDMDGGFNKTEALFKSIIDDVLIGKCGWHRRGIFFFGFGQGGMAGLDVASRLPAKDGEYGGVVSIGGPFPTTAPSPHPKAKTPVILLGAAKNSAITDEVKARVKNVFETVTVAKWRNRNGDEMMKNSEETLPIMQFLARRLRSQAGVPKGATEIV